METKRIECDKIEEKIKKDPTAVIDGIINFDKYWALPSSKPRILWILKEANSNEQTGWRFQDLFSSEYLKGKLQTLNIPTIQRVIYASYGILNDFTRLENIPHITNEEVFKSCEQIAYINIKKAPGGSTAHNASVQDAYNANKALIREQIDTYNPDIIITGNTLQYLHKDIELKDYETQKFLNEQTHYTTSYEWNNKLIINAWHPARRIKGGRNTYCNEIIATAENWWNKNKK
jgi:hypothetical protein